MNAIKNAVSAAVQQKGLRDVKLNKVDKRRRNAAKLAFTEQDVKVATTAFFDAGKAGSVVGRAAERGTKRIVKNIRDNAAAILPELFKGNVVQLKSKLYESMRASHLAGFIDEVSGSHEDDVQYVLINNEQKVLTWQRVDELPEQVFPETVQKWTATATEALAKTKDRPKYDKARLALLDSLEVLLSGRERNRWNTLLNALNPQRTGKRGGGRKADTLKALFTFLEPKIKKAKAEGMKPDSRKIDAACKVIVAELRRK